MNTENTHIASDVLRRTPFVLLALLAAAVVATTVSPSRVGAATLGSAGARRVGDASTEAHLETISIRYKSHRGVWRSATVLIPDTYGDGKENPPIPLIISPHGRNGNGKANAAYFGDLPAVGRFAVVSPDGMGRHLDVNSYGWKGQIDDLARMPEIVERRLKWLRIDHTRVAVLGSSMGGQETLMLVARHPEVITLGAVAMDSVTNLGLRHSQMPADLKRKVEHEVGTTPAKNRGLYAERSPMTFAKRIASSGVPLQIWWSTEDEIVVKQETQSGALFRELRRIDSCAPVSQYVGSWAHSREMRSTELLPIALEQLGLLSSSSQELPESVTFEPAPPCPAL